MRGRVRRGALLALALPLLALGAVAQEDDVPTRSGPVYVVQIAGSINPASSDHLQKAIVQSEEANAAALLIELDTPGGLVASTKDIIQAMLNARVPIIVYVSPQGAWAGSAGTFITIAAHVAAMAPGSSIGAAHPVGIGGGRPAGEDEEKGQRDYAAEKAENLLAAYMESIAEERDRNVEWASKAVRESVAIGPEEAVELKVVDMVARNRAELLEKVDGRTIRLGGKPVALALADARQVEIEMPIATRILNVITDPNVAVLLLIAGVLGLYIEFNQPGLLIPGIVGGVCLILALIAMQILPFSWVGLLLILLGISLFAAEVFVTSYGLLFAAGVVCFLIGGSMLFDRPELSDLRVDVWGVLVPVVAVFALFAGLVVFAVSRTMRREQVAGVSELVGMIGVTASPVGPEGGTVFIHGENWRARSEEPIASDERVETLAVEGLELTVRRAKARD